MKDKYLENGINLLLEEKKASVKQEQSDLEELKNESKKLYAMHRLRIFDIYKDAEEIGKKMDDTDMKINDKERVISNLQSVIQKLTTELEHG